MNTINKTIFSDHQGSEIRLSQVLQTEQPVAFGGFSAKYVITGNETYTINYKKYALKQGEYVLGNQSTVSSVLIDSSLPVKGLCVDISERIISEVTRFFFEENAALENFLLTENFFVHKYSHSDTMLGKALHNLAVQYDMLLNDKYLITSEILFSLAEHIIKDQQQLHRQYSQMSAVKQETNSRLFGYLYDAKTYIDNHFREKISIEAIAQSVCLSEYHFIRLFKNTFAITPHQYIIQKRLAFSKMMLQQQCAIQDIALLAGFADAASFSKTFKANFGYTPKQFQYVN